MQISAANISLNYSLQQPTLGAASASNRNTTQNPIDTSSALASEGNKARQQSQPQELSEEEKQQVAQLQERDREVRAHEAAHIAAAGGLAGGASFSYQTGPDGRAYAVGGEVSIDTSPVNGDPQATIQKAQTIRAAALSPAQPSGADQAVAAAASKMAASARIELSAKDAEEQQQIKDDSSTEEGKNTQKTTPTTPQEITSESSQTGLTASNTGSAANHYQDTADANAPSNLVGQLLNISA